MVHIIVGILGLLMNPFGFWLDKEPPHTVGGGINKLNLLRDHREKIVENLESGISEANALHNETVTQMRILQVNIYLAGGAFLGVLVGIIATSNITIPRLFYASAWLLLISLVVGPIVTFVEWNYEANRATKTRQRQELARMLLVQGGRDDQAIALIGQTIDDIKKMSKRSKGFWTFLIMLKWLATLAFFISICLVAGSFLLHAKNNYSLNNYGVCISCPN